MTTATELLSSTEDILKELDTARKSGPLQKIIIPPCPNLLSRLQEALAQDEPDLNEVARIASSDVAMSASLLKASNSPLYSGGQPCQTIGQALNRLGLEQTAAVMVRFLAQRAIKVHSTHLQRFWERSTKRALAMSYLAAKFPGMSADVAHTYGLFCHVGMPVMAQSIKGYLSTMVEAQARVDRSYIETENANHRTDHAVVGALVSRTWRLAPSVTAAIRLHHDLEALGERSAEPDVNALIAVGLLAEYIMRRHEGLEPDVDWLGFGQTALQWLQASMADLNVWEDELQETLDVA
jgi:HD-like signal output (HDOD) protein